MLHYIGKNSTQGWNLGSNMRGGTQTVIALDDSIVGGGVRLATLDNQGNIVNHFPALGSPPAPISNPNHLTVDQMIAQTEQNNAGCETTGSIDGFACSQTDGTSPGAACVVAPDAHNVSHAVFGFASPTGCY